MKKSGREISTPSTQRATWVWCVPPTPPCGGFTGFLVLKIGVGGGGAGGGSELINVDISPPQ
jgi:hypothetical protein